MEQIKTYLKMFFIKVIDMMDIYFDEQKMNDDQKTKYCNDNFFSTTYYLGENPVSDMENYDKFKIYILDNSRSIYELIVSIVVFSESVDDCTNKIFHHFIRKENTDHRSESIQRAGRNRGTKICY